MNFTDKVQDEIQEKYGLSCPAFECNQNFFRFGNKNECWLVGNTWEYKNNIYHSVTYGNWKENGTASFKVNSFDDKELKDKNFRKNFNKHMEEVNLKVQMQKEEKNAKCIKIWKPLFEDAEKKEHEYTKDKGIQDFCGKVDKNGVLLIPIKDDQGFVGVQRIFSDPASESIVKKFSSGIKITGSFCNLKPFKSAEVIYVTEGYATACTIQEAFPKVPVIAVFTANNLTPSISTIRSINPSASIVICADRDQLNKQGNRTGEYEARKACKNHGNCLYKIPKFENDNGKWSDFNDVHNFNGLEYVVQQLKIDKKDFTSISCLGVKDDKFFYTSTLNQQIIQIGSAHTEDQLTTLIPDLNYWKKAYPRTDLDGNIVGTNWKNASSDLKQRCLQKGMFQVENVRSSGFWQEEGKYLMQNGSKIYNGFKEIDFSAFKKTYVLGKTLPKISRTDMLSEDERAVLMELLTTISVKNHNHGLLLLGWIVCAPVSGCLPWRPHIWLTGESSFGKSYTMENIIINLLYDFCLRPQGTSTEAGVRQLVGSQSLPVIFDEMETDDLKSSERVQEVITLARQASSPNENSVYRGTSSGVAQSFNPNFAICSASINVNLTHKQDKNRWTVIEFSDERKSNEQFKKVESYIKEFVNNEMGKRLVSYTYHHIDILLENYKRIDSILRIKKYSGHFCRQYASLISGYLLILDPVVFDEEALQDHIDMFDFTEFHEQTGKEDSEAFVDYLYDSIIQVEVMGSRESITLSECINKTNLANSDCPYQNVLKRYGIKVDVDYFLVKKTDNKNFKELFKNTKWVNSWSQALGRIKGASNHNKATRIGNKVFKPTKVPFERWSK